MDSRMRLTFACGTCLGLAVGFAAGHLSLWNRVPRQTVQQSVPTDLLGSDGFDLPAILPQSELPASTPTPGGAVVLNDPDLGDEPVHADALIELPEIAGSAPSALSVDHAKPLSPSPSTSQRTQQVQSLESEPLDPEVVNMLKEELQGVSEQQREVWAEALRGMTPEDATGVIFMWKKFGQTNPTASSSPPPLFSSSHPDPAPLPSAQSLKDLLPPPADILEAPQPTDETGQVEAHNRANAKTCGYVNLIPVQQELGLGSESGHHEAAGYRLDIDSVEIQTTGNPAHVAVQNQGFLPVQLTTGETQYTRVGRLVLDSDRRICVDLGSRDLPLSPEVKLPEGGYQLVETNGKLSARVAGNSEPVELPVLQMAKFFDASRLKPEGGGLYSATTASGAAQLVPAELMFGALTFPGAPR